MLPLIDLPFVAVIFHLILGTHCRYPEGGVKTCIDEGFSRKDHVGTIRSPGYPLAYPQNTCNSWSIEGTRGSTITIHFQDLRIAQGPNGICDGDYLEIGPLPQIKVCGNYSQPYISERDHVWIKFMSDGQRSAKGFELHYIVNVPGESCLPGEYRCNTGQCILADWKCDGLTHCTDGSDEQYCPVTTRRMSSTTTSPGPQCDSTQIHCISAYSDQLVCINKEMICNGIDDCLYREDEMSPVCVGTCRYNLVDLMGVFHSPNYPNFYPPNQDCTWAIHIPVGTVQLHVVDFKLEDGRGTDFIEIYDGKNEVNSNIIGRYYGDQSPPKVINGRTNWMIIRFHSNSKYGERGFNMTFQKKGLCLSDQVHCGLNEDDCYHHSQHCDGSWDCKLYGGDERNCGSCQYGSGHYPCGKDMSRCYNEKERCTGLVHCFNNADEMGCTVEQCGAHNGTFLCRNSRCIYDNWRCDQTDDCGDSSDEENCPVSRRVIIAAVIGSLICVLLLVVALGCTCKLYSLRLHEHCGSHETPMSRVQAELNRRPAPPPYHEAMATSLPYDQVSHSGHSRRSRRHGSRQGRAPRPPLSRGHARSGTRPPHDETNRGNNSTAEQPTNGDPHPEPVVEATENVGIAEDSVNSTNTASEMQSHASTTCLIPPSTTSESECESDQETRQVSMSVADGTAVQYRKSDNNKNKPEENDSVFENLPSDIHTTPSSSGAQLDNASADTISASCDTDSALLSLDESTDKPRDSHHADLLSSPPIISRVVRRNSEESLNSEASDVRLIL